METLYNLSQKINELLINGFNSVCIDEETGDIDENKSNEYLSSLNFSFDEKIDNIACYIKDLNLMIKGIKEEEENLYARRKSIERKYEFLKDYISTCMLSVGKTNFESNRNKITFKKSYKLNVFDENVIPKNFFKEQVVVKRDDISIKNAIKNGEIISGAEIETRYNIQIK